MELIPAIDLKDGNCVRLYQGVKDRETTYSNDPVNMALNWEKKGASRLHLVDLDGAFEEESANKSIIRKILQKTTVPCQVGGGLRSEEAVEDLLAAGCDRAIIGTAGVQNPDLLKNLVDRFGPEKIIAGVDCARGKVMVQGWEEASPLARDDWLNQLEGLGVKKIVYTDVSRDGTQEGPDVTGTKQILASTSLGVIASGGVGTLAHLKTLAGVEFSRLQGVIVGRALYEGNFTLEQAIEVVN